MTIKYFSTRSNGQKKLSFEDAVMQGLAPDGGLYLPDSIPKFSPAEIAAMANLPYYKIAQKIMGAFIGDSYNDLIEDTYKNFYHSAIAPLKQISYNQWVMELFHGETLAFKDFALQFLGRLMDRILEERGRTATILGATSGDTGSAAIAGFKNCKYAEVVILFPEGRVSDVQRRQMTTVKNKNIHCIAIKGDFDDCQNLVKTLFLRNNLNLAAVNSINWARIMAQIVYYFHAAISLGSPAKSVVFSVPTGNFGDIYAGHIARKMGLPIKTLIIASNQNDILTRCYSTGKYQGDNVIPTISPSMDIQISSNFERLIYELSGNTTKLMCDFKNKGEFYLSEDAHKKLQKLFLSYSVNDKKIKETIAKIYAETGEILDPHTAVGVYAAQKYQGSEPIITFATAHPAKFPDAVFEACGVNSTLPKRLKNIMYEPEKFIILNADVNKIAEFIQNL